MSDTGRQSFTDKAGSAMKPDSQKPMTEQAKDTARSYADSAQSTLQPQGDKSATQKAGDAVSDNSNQSAGGLLDKAKETMGLGGTTERK